jgi:hypothetical protein
MSNDIDCDYVDAITCPYCGWEDNDSWEMLMSDGDIEDVECGECGKMFSVSCSVSVSYSSQKLCKENEEDHEWKEVEGKYNMRKCSICDKYQLKDDNGQWPKEGE